MLNRPLMLALAAFPFAAGCVGGGDGVELGDCLLEVGQSAPPTGYEVANLTDAFLQAHPEVKTALQNNWAPVDCAEAPGIIQALGDEGATVRGNGDIYHAYVRYGNQTHRIGNTVAVN